MIFADFIDWYTLEYNKKWLILMSRRKILKNPITEDLIINLRKTSQKKEVAIWKDLAKRMEKPSRQMPVVNVDKLEKHCKKGDIAYEVGFFIGAGKAPRPFKSAGSCGQFFKGIVVMDGKNTAGLN